MIEKNKNRVCVYPVEGLVRRGTLKSIDEKGVVLTLTFGETTTNEFMPWSKIRLLDFVDR